MRLNTVLSVVGGLLLVLLAIGSVSLTARSNHRQRTAISCGAQVIDQAITALKVRDQAQIELNDATQLIILARQQAYHALADEIRHTNTTSVSLDDALKNYDNAVVTYGRAVSNDNALIAHAPLPSAECFHQQSGNGFR